MKAEQILHLPILIKILMVININDKISILNDNKNPINYYDEKIIK